MSKPRILIFSPYANWLVHFQIDAVLGLAMSLRGAEVKFLTCDSLYAHCPAVKGRQDCGSCRAAAETVTAGLLMSPEPLTVWTRADDEARAAAWIDGVAPADYMNAHYEECPVGDWALSSTLTQLRSTPEDLAREPQASIYRRYIIDTLKTYWALRRTIDDFRPTHALFFNGRFYPYRAAAEACRRSGTPFVMHERGFAPDSFMFMENRTVLDLSIYRDMFREWRDVALPAATAAGVAEMLDGRRSGKTINCYPFHCVDEKEADIRERFGIPEGKRIIGVFTSSFDELYNCDDYESIDDQVAMLDIIYDYYKDKDVYIVVRHHPYIGGTPYDIAERSMMGRYYRNALAAPPNVRVVMPKERIVSYDLFPYLDYAVAPYSTIALELAMNGVPAAVHALTPHAEAFGFRFPRMTREAIFDLCDRMEASARRHDPEAMRTALRYVNVQCLLFSWNFKGVGIRDHFVPDLRISHTDDLQPGVDPALDEVCGHLTGGGPLHRHPTDADRRRSRDDEDRFLVARIAELAASQAEAAIRSAALDGGGDRPTVLALRLPVTSAGAPDGIERWAARACGVRLRTASMDEAPSSPGAMSAAAARIVAGGTEDCVLLHTGRDQYDERALAYGAAALAVDPGLSCAAFGAWLSRDQAICAYLSADRAAETLRLVAATVGHDPYLLLSTIIWRRDAFLAFAAAAADDDASSWSSRLSAMSSGSGVRIFPEALAMIWL